MMHTSQTLYSTLQAALVDVNQQIIAVRRRVTEGNQTNGSFFQAEEVLGQDGKPVLQDLLLAKAHLLGGMAQLRAAHDSSARKR